MNSPGQLVLSSAPGSTLLWNPLTLLTVSSHQSDTAPGTSLCPYGAGWVAIQKDRKAVRCYQQGKNGEVGEVRIEEGVNCVAAWRYIVAVGLNDGRVELWDARTGGMLLTVTGPSGATAVVLSESWLIVGRTDGSVSEYTFSSLYSGLNEPRFHTRPHTASVSALKIDRHRVLSASADRSIAVIQEGRVTHSLKCDSDLTSLDCDGTRVVAGGSDGSVHCFATAQNKWKWQESPVTAVALLESGHELLVAARHIFILSVHSGVPLRTFEAHNSAVSAMILIDPFTDPDPAIAPLNPAEAPSLRLSLQPDGLSPPNSTTPPGDTPEEDFEKLKTMNQWIYGLWVDGWL